MNSNVVDVTNHEKISRLGARVLRGEKISRDEALWIFHLENSADIFDLISWANRLREHFKGNKIHLCSIVNAKAGACSENCKFCAQSSFYQTGSPKYGFVGAGGGLGDGEGVAVGTGVGVAVTSGPPPPNTVSSP